MATCYSSVEGSGSSKDSMEKEGGGALSAAGGRHSFPSGGGSAATAGRAKDGWSRAPPAPGGAAKDSTSTPPLHPSGGTRGALDCVAAPAANPPKEAVSHPGELQEGGDNFPHSPAVVVGVQHLLSVVLYLGRDGGQAEEAGGQGREGRGCAERFLEWSLVARWRSSLTLRGPAPRRSSFTRFSVTSMIVGKSKTVIWGAAAAGTAGT